MKGEVNLMKEEKIRLNGHMRTHKALIKSIIRTRKFEISCISAPQPVKAREDGYCYMYIDGYPTEGRKSFRRWFNVKKIE